MSRAAYLLGLLVVWSGAVRARDLIGEAQARHEAEVAGLEVPRPLSLVRLEAAVRACLPGGFFGEPRHLHPEAPLTDQVRVRRILAGCREVLEAAYASPDEDMGELLGYHETPTSLHIVQVVELERVRAQLDGEDPAGQLRRGLRLLALSSRHDDQGWANSGGSTHRTLQLLWPLFSDLSPEHAWRAWLQVEALVVAAVPGEGGPVVDDACLLRPPAPPPTDLRNRMAWACHSESWGTRLEERRLMRLLLAARRAHAAGRWPLKPEALHAFGGPSPEVLRAAFAEVELVGEAAPQAVFGVLARKVDNSQVRRNRSLRGQDTRWTERGARLALCLDPHPMCGDAAAPNPARWMEARAQAIDMTREVAEALRRADGDFAAAGFELVILKDGFGWQWSLGEHRMVIQAATEHPTLTLEEGPDAGDESAPVTEGGRDLVGMVLDRPRNLVVDLRHLLRGPLGEEAQAIQDWMTRKRPFRLAEMGQMVFTGPPGMDYRAIGAAREKGQLPPDSVRWRVSDGLYFSHAGEAAGWERWWGRRLPDHMPAVLAEIYGDEQTFAAIVHAGWRNTKMWSP